MAWPATVVAAVAVRKKLLSGVTQRMSSSTAPGTRLGSFASASHWSGCSQKVARPRAMTVRVVSAPPEMTRPGLVDERLDAERAPVDLGVRPGAHEVVGRAGLAGLDRLGEDRDELHDRRHEPRRRGLVGDRLVVAHQPLRPRRDVGPVLLGEPEQVRGEAGRELRRELGHDLELTGLEEAGDEAVDAVDEERLEGADGLGGEAARDQPALRGVPGIVERDHVVLAAREERAVALARHEDLVVALHVDDLGVAEHGPQPVLVVARERALRPQLPERLVHRRQVDVERGVEEVGNGRS